MATSSKKPRRRPLSPATPPRAEKERPAEPPPSPTQPVSVLDRILGGFDAVYRFLASVKLAVITLGTLVFVLSYATFYESWYGTRAAGEDIYKSPAFALLLTFLGANILCAALIRYPWKRRQTGFVITHAGLLTILFGTFLTFKFSDEGHLSMAEGESTNKVVRQDQVLFRVRPLNDGGQAAEEFRLPFAPGTDPWNPAQPDPVRAVTLAAFHPFNLERLGTAFASVFTPSSMPARSKVLPVQDNAFQFEILDHIPASGEKYLFEAARDGTPMLKVRPKIRPPGAPKMRDIFPLEEQRWFVPDNTFLRKTENLGPAQLAFQYIDDREDEQAEDFLHPPKVPEGQAAEAGVAWLRYTDKAGKRRRVEWPLDGQEGKTLTLPESDLTIRCEGVKTFDVAKLQAMVQEQPGLMTVARRFVQVMQAADAKEIAFATFLVKKGGGEESPYLAFDILPPGLASSNPDVAIGFLRPSLGGGQFGRIEFLGTRSEKIYYRIFDRKGFKTSGPTHTGETIQAFGGPGSDSAISLTCEVESFLISGRSRLVYEPIELPQGQLGNGIPAAYVRMTVKGDSKEFWVQSTPNLQERPVTIEFPTGSYQIAYDMKRHELGFDMELVDFEIGFDPGTRRESSYKSEILVKDPGLTLKSDPDAALLALPCFLGAGHVALDFRKTPYSVSMNEPYHNGYWTFYQSAFDPIRDEFRRETGKYRSVFQVRYDPPWVWGVVYLGCATVVLGAFVQFYMRAGVFSGTARPARAERPEDEVLI